LLYSSNNLLSYALYCLYAAIEMDLVIVPKNLISLVRLGCLK
jgi:hypothetical protein